VEERRVLRRELKGSRSLNGQRQSSSAARLTNAHSHRSGVAKTCSNRPRSTPRLNSAALLHRNRDNSPEPYNSASSVSNRHQDPRARSRNRRRGARRRSPTEVTDKGRTETMNEDADAINKPE